MSEKKSHHSLAGLAALLVAVLCISVFIGRYPQPPWMSPRLLWSDPLARQLVLNLRLPRILTACLLGMVLSASGVVLQMLFRNPMVEPGFLGVSQGAAFGAALGIIILDASPLFLQGMSTLFALLGLLFSHTLARKLRYGGWTLRLILAGIAVSAVFSSGVGLLKIVADPLSQLPELMFWLLGALWGANWTKLITILPVVVICMVMVIAMRWRLNVLSLEDETVTSLGINAVRERNILLLVVVAATAALVSISGIVGWVGLIVPQLARRWYGADSRYNLPGAVLIGGLFTLICD
ncbi:MAG: iron ABC transporter permease, partial [Anaerolineae bacterium]|nr:iron ABC transporter permease [Anaerolineae bacterium]